MSVCVFVCRRLWELTEAVCVGGREAQIEDVLPPIKIEGPTSLSCHICSTSKIYYFHVE